MSSTNNAAPDRAIISIGNYAIIARRNQNHNQSIPEIIFNDHETAIALISLIIMSLFLGTYYIFPILFPISLCSFFMAVYGELSEKYYFFIPYMLTVAWNIIYGIICVIFYITFYAGDKEFFLNKALYFCWEEKAEILEKIGDGDFFEIHLIFTVIEILVGIGTIFVTKLRYTELQKKYVEELRHVAGEQAVKSYRESLQQNGLVIVSNERLQSARVAQVAQNLQNENPPNAYAEFMAQIPPPPSYQSNTRLSPPQNGTLPPTYSIALELDSLNDDPSQQSINNIHLLSDITQNSNTTLSSPKNNSIDSTATISPSSSILD